MDDIDKSEFLANQLPEDVNLSQPEAITLPNRIVVVDIAYYESPSEPTLQVDSRFTRDVESDEQVYIRKCKAKEEWSPLDIGWIETTSMILLINQKETNSQTIPTKEEIDLANSKILQLAYLYPVPHEEVPNYFIIPPGESIRFYPNSLKHLHVRCSNGTTKYTLYAFPG